MKCTICGNQTFKYENTQSYDCGVCLSFFSSFDEQFRGINLTNNVSNDNYISLTLYDEIYYKCNGKSEKFNLNITLETDKEKYKFLKSFLDNMIFI